MTEELREAVCQCGCYQSWLVMPGEVATSLAPECQMRERRRRLAAERERRKALKEGR